MRSSVCGLLMTVACLVGCGDSVPAAKPAQGMVPAKGVLRHKGSPMPFYRISVVPKDGRPAVGDTDAEGVFTLGTDKPGDGALPGVHPLSIAYTGPPSNDPNEGMTVFTQPGPPPVKLAPKHAKPETSGITVAIPPGGSSELVIELE